MRSDIRDMGVGMDNFDNMDIKGLNE